MNEINRSVDTGKLVAGVILIGLGILFLIDRIGVADFGYVFQHYWPMVLVLIGLPKLFRREAFWSGMWLVTLGVWMQIVRLHLFGLTFSNAWPLLLIAIGAGMIVRTFIQSAIPNGDQNAP